MSIPLPKLAVPGNKTIIAIYFDGVWLKILHASKLMGRYLVDGIHAKKASEVVPEEILMFLENLEQVKSLGSRLVIATHPAQFTTMRVLSLPSVNQKEIKEMVELQVEKLSPHGKEEALRDFQILSKDDTGYSKVAVLMSHQDVVDQVVKFSESIKIELDRVGSDLDGMVGWLRKIRERHSEIQNGSTLLIDIDAQSSSVMIVENDKAYFHRNIPMGYQEISSDDSLQQIGRFTAEVRKSLEVFEAENLNIKPIQMVVTGLASRTATIKPLLEHECQMPVILASSFDICELAQEQEEERDKLPVSFTSLVGTLFVSGGIDFTPEVIRVQKAFRARTKALMVLGVQLLLSLVLVVLFLVEVAQKDLFYHAWLTKQFRSDQKKADEVKLLIDQLSVVKDRIQSKGKMLDAIVEMHKISPPAIRWDSLNYTNGEGVVLNGFSNEMPKVFEYVTALEKVPMFKEPNAKKVAKRKVKDEDVTEFEINYQFN